MSAEPLSIEVRAVNSFEELEDCLRLRFEVYKALNYLPDSVSKSSDQYDIDFFDASALHFAAIAIDGEQKRAVGTARVILANPIPHYGRFERLAVIKQKQLGLIAQIFDARPILLKRLTQDILAGSLPTLISFKESAASLAVNGSPTTFCELSRLVVKLDHRGFGLSKMLTNACIAAAVELSQSIMLLECVPSKICMYEKHGFSVVPGMTARLAWNIEQVAILMALKLDRMPQGFLPTQCDLLP